MRLRDCGRGEFDDVRRESMHEQSARARERKCREHGQQLRGSSRCGSVGVSASEPRAREAKVSGDFG